MAIKKRKKKFLFKLKILNRTYSVFDKDVLENRSLAEVKFGKGGYVNLSRQDNDTFKEYKESLFHEIFHILINQFKELEIKSEEEKADAFSSVITENWKKLNRFMCGKAGKRR